MTANAALGLAAALVYTIAAIVMGCNKSLGLSLASALLAGLHLFLGLYQL